MVHPVLIQVANETANKPLMTYTRGDQGMTLCPSDRAHASGNMRFLLFRTMVVGGDQSTLLLSSSGVVGSLVCVRTKKTIRLVRVQDSSELGAPTALSCRRILLEPGPRSRPRACESRQSEMYENS